MWTKIGWALWNLGWAVAVATGEELARGAVQERIRRRDARAAALARDVKRAAPRRRRAKAKRAR